MPTAHLALDRRTNPAAVYRYLLGTPGQVGNTFGAVGETSLADREQNTQRVCQFKGSNDLYCLRQPEIWKFNSGTGNWASVYTTGPFNDATGFGPIVMQVNGVPTMVVVYMESGSGNVRIVTSTDGTSWSLSAALPTGFAASTHATWGALVVGETIWFGAVDGFTTGVRLCGANPAAGSLTVAIPPRTLSRTEVDQCVYNGRHYVLTSTNANPDRPEVHEFDGISFTSKWAPGVVGATALTAAADAKWCLFTDGTSMFAIGLWHPTGDTGLGWTCFKLVESGGTLTPTDITATVIPSAIRPTTGGVSQDERFSCLVDQEANPGGVPEIYLYRSASGATGSPFLVYKWNGDAALIGNAGAPNDSGGSAAHVMGFNHIGTGKVFWTEDQLDVSIESIVQALGGQTISFRLYSATGTETVDVDFFYSDEGESAQTGPATLLNASAGSIVANVITGLTANNGATLYTVLWDTTASGDNVPNGTSANLQARVSV